MWLHDYRFAGILWISFLNARPTHAEKRHLAWKPYCFHSETHGVQRDWTLNSPLAHEHASHCWHTSCSKGVFKNSPSWKWVPVNFTSSLCWVLCYSTSCVWGTYEITLQFFLMVHTCAETDHQGVRNCFVSAMNIRWISKGGTFRILQTLHSHKFPCDQRWHKSSFSCFRRGNKQ